MTTTPGVRKGVSATKPATRVQDPVCLLHRRLDGGIAPQACWPTRGEGCLAALHTSEVPASGSTQAKRLWSAIGGSPISAICIHRTEADLLEAAMFTICWFGWLEQPSLAAMVCATAEEQYRLQSLISGRWKMEFIPPGMDPAAAPSVVLASEVASQRWMEVFVAPDCLALPAADLAPVVAVAALGLHTLPLPQLQRQA